MECESGRQGLKHHRIRPIHYIVSIVLLLSGLVSVESPSLTWAAVYECLDVRGKPLLTNRTSHLHNCHMLSEETTSAQTPSGVSPPPEVSPTPISSDRPSPPSYVPPMPPPLNLPTDHGASAGSLSASNQGEQSLPSPPCAHRLNPLNPLNAPPCVRSDHSEAQSQPEAAPTPSP
jgi:hypothetical protein